VLEEGNTLQQMLQRHMGEVEIVHVPDMAGAVTALNQAPALALIVNAPPLEVLREDRTVSPASLRQLPYATPAIICWAPGEMDAARRMGVVHYLVKPITRDALVGSVAELGPQCHTVLIVDDDQEVLQLFSRMLSTAGVGYRVLRARNGQQALAIMRERHPDAVLLDLMMPGMDGYQVLHEKSQDPAIQSIPVIVTSSRDPGGPMVADVLAITRGGGLSMRDLAISIQMLSAKLAPTQSPAGLAPPGNLAA
jgi:CheY-like chemotaxis protein